MAEFVRVHLPGVGEWSQDKRVPLPAGAKVLDRSALDSGGRPLPDIPEGPLTASESSAGEPASPPDQAGTAGKTKPKE